MVDTMSLLPEDSEQAVERVVELHEELLEAERAAKKVRLQFEASLVEAVRHREDINKTRLVARLGENRQGMYVRVKRIEKRLAEAS